MPKHPEQLHHFIFDNTDIKGEIITLNNSLQELRARRHYPDNIQQLLGKFMAAAALLSSTLKFAGTLTLQARGKGPVPLIMAEVNHRQQLRAVASISDRTAPHASVSNKLPELIGEGTLSLILDPEQGERYQGIVPLDADDLDTCLEHYFAQSAQLPSRIWLRCDGDTAGGLILQRLPQQVADTSTNQTAWETRTTLAETLTEEELLCLDHTTLLTRLFHEEGVRLLASHDFGFSCSCSKTRCSQALLQLGLGELQQLLDERGSIEVDCQFCGFSYNYSQGDITTLFAPPTQH